MRRMAPKSEGSSKRDEFASAQSGRKALAEQRERSAAKCAGGTPNCPSVFDVRQLFGHLHQELACFAALNLVEGLHDADRTGGLHEAEDTFRAAGRLARCIAARAAAEEERDR